MLKKTIILLLVISITGILMGSTLEERLETLVGENAKGYLSPLANSLGAGLNSGLMNTAKVQKPLRPSLRVGASLVMIPKSDRTFWTTPPDFKFIIPDPRGGDRPPIIDEFLFKQTPVETATVFGPIRNNAKFEVNPDLKNAIDDLPEDLKDLIDLKDITDNLRDFNLPPGINLPGIPVPHATASLGLPFGFEIMGRYMAPISLGSNVGTFNYWGLGLKHSIDQHIPIIRRLPVYAAVQGFYQSVNVANIITANTLAYSLIGSAQVPLLGIGAFAAIGYETADFNVKFNVNLPVMEDGTVESRVTPVNLNFAGSNTVKTTLGLNWTLLRILNITGDVSFAESTSYNFGLGVQFPF